MMQFDENSSKVGHLSDCTAPNCVSTQSTNPSRRLAPLQVIGSPMDAIAVIRRLLSEQKRTSLIAMSDDYIHAEARSAVFGFVDDIEFLVDRAFILQFRSAARTGFYDFGVNRRRMVRLREQLKTRFQAIFREI